MDEYSEKNPRLGVQDKRDLFCSLLAMVERLLMLNRFPVDMVDFALSLQEADVEDAWVLLNDKVSKSTLAPIETQCFSCNDRKWMLHIYPEDKVNTSSPRVFMDIRKVLDIDNARRHQTVVKEWCRRQERLEDQCLRAAKVLKAIVGSCNTVGQYKRVSPELITFLPEKYRNALQDYTKKSPYPAMTIEPKEIDTTMASLAFAALQPEHLSEEEYNKRPKWGRYRYSLLAFPRSKDYDSRSVRKLEI